MAADERPTWAELVRQMREIGFVECLETGTIALSQAMIRCDQTLETAYVDTMTFGFRATKPVATFCRHALAETFVEQWNAALPECGYVVVCETCFQTRGHSGYYGCFGGKARAAG